MIKPPARSYPAPPACAVTMEDSFIHKQSVITQCLHGNNVSNCVSIDSKHLGAGGGGCILRLFILFYFYCKTQF